VCIPLMICRPSVRNCCLCVFKCCLRMYSCSPQAGLSWKCKDGDDDTLQTYERDNHVPVPMHTPHLHTPHSSTSVKACKQAA
jgi:hypothetical protein